MSRSVVAPARRFTPYAERRSTGIPWLPELPSHWEMRRLKTTASVRLSNVDKKTVEGERRVRLCNYTDVYYNDRITGSMPFMEATASDSQVRTFRLRAGDVIVTKDSESWDDIAVPALVAEDLDDVVCGYHLAHVRPRAGVVEGAYLARAFAALGIADQFKVAANGITRFGLGGDALANGVFPLPPLPEQRAIAAFLDRETARIDSLVAKKERLIELLHEKRPALIARTVTKGFDPSVPMKDSGLEWLGKIPEHWGVNRLMYLTKRCRPIMYGIVLPGPDVPEGVLIVKGGDLSGGVLARDGLKRTAFEIEAGHARSRLQTGDLVYAIRGSIGEVAMVPSDLEGANITQDAARISYRAGVLGRWLLHVLRAAPVFAQLDAGALGATIKGINIRDLKRAQISMPPEEEQRAIATLLDRESARIDALIVKIREGMNRLREYRTALISAAVTGKIDVREEAA